MNSVKALAIAIETLNERSKRLYQRGHLDQSETLESAITTLEALRELIADSYPAEATTTGESPS